MVRNIKSSAFFFDFDGVLIDSATIKTDAYRELFRFCSPEVLSEIVAYHQMHAGISRVEKIAFAYRHIIGTPLSSQELSDQSAQYSALVFEKVIETEWIPGAEAFLQAHYQHIPLFVISGTPENELKEVIRLRGMRSYFREILGSPTRKPAHIRALIKRYNLEEEKCFFIGDALTDYYAAQETGVPFIGITGEAEFPRGTMVLPDCIGLEEAINSREKIS